MSLVCAIKQQQSLIWIFHSIHSMRKGPTTTTLFLIKHIFDLFYTHTWKKTSIHPLLVLIRSFCICTSEDLENQISSISIFFCSHMQHMAGARPHQNHSQSFEILSMGLSQRWVIREKQAQSCRHLVLVYLSKSLSIRLDLWDSFCPCLQTLIGNQLLDFFHLHARHQHAHQLTLQNYSRSSSLTHPELKRGSWGTICVHTYSSSR